MTVKWVGKRMMLGILVLFIVSFLSFFIMHAGPGSSATAYYGGNAQTLTAAEKERISKAFALDRPLIIQYGAWLKETVKGNLGMSVKEGRPVATILGERLPNTLLLVGVSMFFIITGSIWLGMACGNEAGIAVGQGAVGIQYRLVFHPGILARDFIHLYIRCHTRCLTVVRNEEPEW